MPATTPAAFVIFWPFLFDQKPIVLPPRFSGPHTVTVSLSDCSVWTIVAVLVYDLQSKDGTVIVRE